VRLSENLIGNECADWVRKQTESYRYEGGKRLLEAGSESERHSPAPAADNWTMPWCWRRDRRLAVG